METLQTPGREMTDLTDYVLHLADNALILGHRNSEWTGHGPVLEQDIAISNIALDLIGQARMLYQYAARLCGGTQTEDSLAYLRDAWDFKNCLLVELGRGDWAFTVLRQFFFSTYQYLLYQKLTGSRDATLAAIAEKAVKEVSYHLRWSGEWVVRLGDGTQESHRRMEAALLELWAYTGELTTDAPYESRLSRSGVAVAVPSLQVPWTQKVTEVLREADLTLSLQALLGNTWMQQGGKLGTHTEHLGFILAEMQYMQRTYPGSNW